ncbi:MAG: SCO family protein [Rhizobiales bacterium]|nr:SCO family protein [Hyphomicrobiales bacterium]
MTDQPTAPKLWISLLTAAIFAIAVFVVGFSLYVTFWAKPELSRLALQNQQFTLVNHRGESVTPVNFAGRPSVIFFGYTHCPEICPTTLNDIGIVAAELGVTADDINFAFVSIDPERDTVELLAQYMPSFDPHIDGLTGSLEEISAFASGLGVYFRRTAEGPDYEMDHTSWIYLFSRDGEFVRTANLRSPNENLTEALRALAN